MSRKHKKDKNQVAYADRDGDKNVVFVEPKATLSKGELLSLAIIGTVVGLLCVLNIMFGLNEDEGLSSAGYYM